MKNLLCTTVDINATLMCDTVNFFWDHDHYCLNILRHTNNTYDISVMEQTDGNWETIEKAEGMTYQETYDRFKEVFDKLDPIDMSCHYFKSFEGVQKQHTYNNLTRSRTGHNFKQ